MKKQARIFISYARKDGSDFAKSLRTRLIEIFGEHAIWRDRDEMEGGIGWWNQIQEALEAVDFMVLVATPAAMASDIVAKEWRTARQLGVCVYPVLVPSLPIDFQSLPRWMRDAHFYTFPDEWDTFINYLKHPCEALRVPFMAPPPPAHFVNRTDLTDQLLKHLLDESRQNPVAITTALKGSGGFGKTTLAQALCADEKIQTAFDDGILWVTLGENPDVLSELKKVYKALTGVDGNFQDTDEGGRLLSEALADKDCLMVIDDVWHITHLQPFLRGGNRCARLITTRDVDIATKAKAKTTEVDEMTPEEARALLGNGINGLAQRDLDALAKRLGYWALMLEIANGMMHTRQNATNGTWADAYQYISRLLDRRGVLSIRTDNAESRKQGADGVLAVSLDLLSADKRTRLCQLGVFKDDQDVPIRSVMALWGLDDLDTEDQLTEFARLSLIKYRSSTASIRLHDVVREYFLTQLTDARAVHDQLIRGYGDPYALPDGYAWRFYAYHLAGAGRLDELRPLLLAYRWLSAKLSHTDIDALLDDCDEWLRQGKDEPIRLIRSALEMSANIVTNDPSALAHQLAGRLMHHDKTVDDIHTFLDAIAPPPNSLFPIHNGYDPLNPAGGMMLRTMRHDDSVNGAVELRDGRILSWSDDSTLLLWGADGSPITKMTGHTSSVLGAVELRDGRILSWSEDNTLLLWGADGSPITKMTGHTKRVDGAVELRDGRILSWSEDKTLLLWGADGSPITKMTGHTKRVDGAVELRDGRILSWSDDSTLLLWGADGSPITPLTGHTKRVDGVVELRDGRILSWSEDKTLLLWGADGSPIAEMTGHTGSVRGAVELRDGRILSWSSDSTLRLWGADGSPIAILTGHTNEVTGAVELRDGRILSWAGDIFSQDKTLLLWGADGSPIAILTGHTNEVTGAVGLRDGRILSWSWDKTLRLWGADGSPIARLTEHTDWVKGAVELRDGRILSWSHDSTLRLWGADGSPIARLTEHTDWVKGAVELRDGRILSWSSDDTLRLWGADGSPITALTGHTWPVELRDRRILSWAGGYNREDKTLWLWGADGSPIARLTGHTGSVNGAVELRDGRILSWSLDRTLLLWGADGSPITALMGHTEWVKGAVELRDGRILSWSDDNTLRLWRADGAPITPLTGHTEWVKGAVELRDGRILSWSEDTTLRLWSADGSPIATLTGHTGSVFGAVELRDGRILSWSDDRTLRLWGADGVASAVLEQDYQDGDRRIIAQWANAHGLMLDDVYPPESADPIMAGGRVRTEGSDIIIYHRQTGERITTFYGDAPLTTWVAVTANGHVLAAGDNAGRVVFLRWVGGG